MLASPVFVQDCVETHSSNIHTTTNPNILVLEFVKRGSQSDGSRVCPILETDVLRWSC